MSNFKEASRQKLRFQTPVGLVTTEQLWDLPLQELDAMAVKLEEDYNKSGKKSFLVAKSKKDKQIKLALDIIIEVLVDKVQERDAAAQAASDKEHNQKILERIQQAKDKELDGLSVKELEKLLR